MKRMTELAEKLLLRYGFEPMISLTLTTDRAVTCVISISYDRDVNGEDGRAMSCYRELLDQMTDSGFYSYRLGIQARHLFDPETAYGRLLATLKTALDPNQILAPGRYLAAIAPQTDVTHDEPARNETTLAF